MNGLSIALVLFSIAIILSLVLPPAPRVKQDGEHWLPGPPDMEK